APVSKTGGCRFDSCRACLGSNDLAASLSVVIQSRGSNLGPEQRQLRSASREELLGERLSPAASALFASEANMSTDTTVVLVHGARLVRRTLPILVGLALAAPLVGQARHGHFYHVN